MVLKFDSDETHCPHCGEERKVLTKHIQKVHPEKCEWDCPTCGKPFPTRKGMRKHHSLSHDESLLRSECDYCGEEMGIANPGTTRFCSRECYTEWQKGNTHGEKNNNWSGRVEKVCGQCREGFEVIPSISKSRRFCCRECYADWLSENVVGENHPLWDGGHVQYYGENWWLKRSEALERDGKCRICGADEGLLDVHHITPIKKFDEPENANTLDNLIVLCRSCHMSVENGEKECPEP